MRGRKNPPFEIVPASEGAPLTFDRMAQAYLEDDVLQRYRTLNTARPRVEHLRTFVDGWRAEAITADAVRRYQLLRRDQGAEAATINRETSALSRMFQLAVRCGLLDRMPLFPKRLEENRPRQGGRDRRAPKESHVGCAGLQRLGGLLNCYTLAG